MYTFGGMENVASLINEVDVLEGAIARELSAQDVVASGIAAGVQVDIDIAEKELARHRVVLSSKLRKRIAAAQEEGRGRLEELRRKLADAKHKLAVVQSPILILPYEITAEIFNWHMLMGGNLNTVLLVCKGWITVAYSSPRLWSRIVVINCFPPGVCLQGAIRCETVDYLRSVLSRAQASPLQVELSLSNFEIGKDDPQSSSLRYGPQAYANRKEAISLILNDKTLTRCTHLALDYEGSPRLVENMTVLPLLSSLYIGKWLEYSQYAIVRSLIKLSPSLRHIRWHRACPPFEDLDVCVSTKRIESYDWLYPGVSCHVFHESSSLRELGVIDRPAIALTLPALQVLRWSLSTYTVLHFITAPQLHTLILSHKSAYTKCLSASSITLPNLRVAIHGELHDMVTIRGFRTPALEHLSIQSVTKAPNALLELFDGSVHMPTPKSLHLQCAFTDAELIAVLGRLPWLEEFQIAGTITKDAFWEGLTPSSNPTWRSWLPKSYQDERANRILLPNLKVLLVSYLMVDMYNHPRPLFMWVTEGERANIADYYSRGAKRTVVRASAVAVAREQAGCPLETLACWSPKKEVEVLIGSLDTLPQRPK